MSVVTPDLILFCLLGLAIVGGASWQLFRTLREQGVDWRGGPINFLWGPPRRITAEDEPRMYWTIVYLQAALVAFLAVSIAWMIASGLVSK
jgi:hypothetical protein